ncbi:uncharacterized protein LAESUDRAFT_431580 [Laetiporus sulphureus 93-53]|uniref:DUF6533 domain-containing protein n=1 Tax=Laetiporus sulphureus 93-53 TaxID=1314785 RepID=A0A165C511_9APHY|nr:uncharacterized protein LAESUDRAFT_431580 [Laetiporus sulphureus 93-53]KZT02215.1 hypothetical protein LAESUDRAFT_431580 [Laetiporus sulphureus 93-53]
MSNVSVASLLAQEEVVDFQQIYINNYCYLAAAALIFYEYIVTFSQEVHVIWGARLTTVTVIFAINRYMLMVEGISLALNVVWWHTPLLRCCQHIEQGDKCCSSGCDSKLFRIPHICY